jgi:tetratricopeptide (TPR) repeat protein
MRPRSFFAFAVLICAIAVPCSGQTPPSGSNAQRRIFSISGRVNDDSDEHAIDNVRLNLASDGLVLNSVYSSDGGNFEFEGVAPGNYVITVQLDGYEPYSTTVTVSRAPVTSFSVGLTKSMSGTEAKSTATISVHQLGVPRKAHDVFEKGVAIMRSSADYRGALAQFQSAVKIFPGYYEACAMQGVAFIALNDTSSAEIAVRKSIELSSGRYPDAFFLLAGLLTEAGNYAEAETAARTATALNASSWAAHYELAHALYMLKRSDEAEPEATRARDLNHQNPKIVLLLANIHLDRRKYSAMLEDIDTYLQLDPSGPQADQVRKDREQVLQALQKNPEPPSLDHLEQ